jgi:hypothetical protein
MESVAEPLLQLFLANRHDARILEMRSFGSGKEFQRRLRIVENQILKVLIMGHQAPPLESAPEYRARPQPRQTRVTVVAQPEFGRGNRE